MTTMTKLKTVKRKTQSKKPFKPSKTLIRNKLLMVINPDQVCGKYRPVFKKSEKHYMPGMENSEYFEQVMCDLLGWKYNTARGGVDATGLIHGKKRKIEFKRERPTVADLCGQGQWSFHKDETRKELIKEDLALVCSGMINGTMAYILLVENVNETDILSPREKYSEAKVPKTWKAFKDAKKVHLLYINRKLVKNHASAGFANYLLNMRETFEDVFGFNFRDFLKIGKDTPQLYYNKGGTVGFEPTFTSHPTAVTCIELSPTKWNRGLKPKIKKLTPGEQIDLQLSQGVLTVKNHNGDYFIKSSIDNTKTMFRPLDITIEI